MSKLIIDKLSIDKSDKDIQTGILYEFSEGLNCICGNNEAGKSSLMKFIKEGLFRPVKTDTGRIYFSVDSEKYRADIKNSQKKQDRLKLFNSNDNEINADIIEQFINQKYFEQGFTINLDNLMSLKYDTDGSLVNVIKDPSGDKLNKLIQPYSNLIISLIGDKNKPKKTLSEITNRINEIDVKISSLTQKEEEYNNLVFQIKNLQEELNVINKKEKYADYIQQERENNKKIDEINSEIKIKNSQFNSKLYDNRQEYAQIVQNIGVFISNKDKIKSLEEKTENTNSKINDLTLKLKESFGIYAQEQDFINFKADYDKINKIKDLYEEINKKNSDINAYEKTNEDIEETILKIENDINSVKSSYNGMSIDEITTLFSFIDNRIKQIKSIDFDINEIQKQKNIKQPVFIVNQICLWLFALGFICTATYFLFVNQLKFAGIFIGLFLVLLAVICFLFRNNKIQDEIKRKEDNKKVIISELKENIKSSFPEISDYVDSFFIIKLEETVQNLKTNINKITQISIDKEFNLSKIKNNNDKILNLKEEIIEKSKEIENLLKDDITTNGKIYIESANIINNLKDEFLNIRDIKKELEQLKQKNIEICSNFNSFISNNSMNINLSSDIEENFNELRKYTENNNEVKKELDRLLAVWDNLKQLQKGTDITFEDIKEEDNIASVLQELEFQRKEKQNLLHNYEVAKSRLEEVESLAGLKNEKNILLNKYRNIVKEIITAKAVLNTASIAKKNFDKTQPDLINAQKYLNILTNGKYSKINLELEEIKSEDETIIKRWSELSRGTKEQLYLALRFGYASNYTQKDNRRPHLPLIIDDAFVNFDSERIKCTLACLYEFSKTNQILFFTCHTQIIKKYFEELGLKEQVNSIEL